MNNSAAVVINERLVFVIVGIDDRTGQEIGARGIRGLPKDMGHIVVDILRGEDDSTIDFDRVHDLNGNARVMMDAVSLLVREETG